MNPEKTNLLFARFISENRGEPPDIDVDFEHERREEVIQYIYQRYGRDRAAICATVVHYRSRRAIREVGKVLGLTEDVTAALAKTVWGYSDGLPDDHIRQAGLDPSNPAIRQAVALADELIGFPRHLSQHVGGFVLTRAPLDETVPIGNAAMDERTFIEWDKDDIDTLGLMKVDVLALGMLSCLRRGLDLLQSTLRQGLFARHAAAGRSRGLRDAVARRFRRRVPGREPRADVDAAAVEAAMFLRSRHRGRDRAAGADPGRHGASLSAPARRHENDKEPIIPRPHPAHGPADELKEVLKRTLGVPLFQEQAMQIAITAAKFTPDEADGLRRAMATFRHNGNVHLFRDKFINGMTARGYDRDFAEALFRPDRRLWRIRFSRKPRGELCAPGLCLGVDQMPLSGRVLRRHPQQPADGFLSAGAARARCARARRRNPRRRRQFQRLGLHAGAGRRRSDMPCASAFASFTGSTKTS